jgi:hypothetical protein
MSASVLVYAVVAPIVAFFALRYFVRRQLTAVLWVFAVAAGLAVVVWGGLFGLAVAGVPENPPIEVKLLFLYLTVFAAIVSRYAFKRRYG